MMDWMNMKIKLKKNNRYLQFWIIKFSNRSENTDHFGELRG